jgi:aldehyde dehydrogenase family 7 protein A1
MHLYIVFIRSTKHFIYYQSAAIIMPDADLSLAVPAVFFGSVGTAGQRCTSTRRLYLHRAIAPEFLERLKALYASPALHPGDPLDARTLLGPLHSRAALNIYDDTITELKDAGAQFLLDSSSSERGRYENLTSPLDRGNFVRPTIAMIPKQLRSQSKFKSRVVDADADASKGAAAAAALWAKERFVPVLCVAEFEELEEAIAWNNAVPQGLSSSLWTRDLRNVGKWIGPAGSDTGIVNVSVFMYFSFG